MRRRDLLLPAAGALVGCGPTVQPKGLPVVNVALNFHWSMAPTYLAHELGLFRDAGLDVRIHRLRHPQSVPLLVDGKLDIVYSALPPSVLNAFTQGTALRVAAGREVVREGCGEFLALYLNRKSCPPLPAGPQHLRGKRIAARKGGGAEFALDVYLRHFGLSQADVQTVPLDDRAAAIAVSEGQVDGIISLEFARSPLSRSSNVVRVQLFSDLKPGFQLSFIIFGPSLIEGPLSQRPDLGARYLAAYLEGVKQFVAGKTPKFAEEFARDMAFDKDQSIDGCRQTFEPEGTISVASVQEWIDWSQRRSYIEQPFAAARLCDSRFLDRARQLRREGNWRG